MVFIMLLLFTNNAWGWISSSEKDKMTGEISAGAISAQTKPLEDMPFPYQDIKSWIVFGCNKKGSEWVGIIFSQRPNLTNSKTQDGYNLITERIKWDDLVTSITFAQNWGSRVLLFQDDQKNIQNIMTKSIMLLELSWYGEGVVYFQYSLKGSSKAIQDARNICRK